jgi:hypothetical protein
MKDLSKGVRQRNGESGVSRYAESNSCMSGKKWARSPVRSLLRKTTRQLEKQWRALSANAVGEMYTEPSS